MKHKTIYTYLIILFASIVSSCSHKEAGRQFRIQGVWLLDNVEFYDREVVHYPMNGMTWMRIYDDSCFYNCQFSESSTGFMVTPVELDEYTLIDKGQNSHLYLQGDNTYPLSLVDDSTMVIQERGRLFTWKLYNGLEAERKEDIIKIVNNAVNNKDFDACHYVFSQAEKELTTTKHTLIYVIIGISAAFLVLFNFFFYMRKEKKRVESELRRIRQERQSMPETVRQALDTVEEDFLQSDFYVSLRKRIARGEHLKKDEWDGIEQRLNSVYPGFTNKLMSLYKMSETELRVCLLLKLNAAPSEIANVLCKDTSSISSIRSRLYSKIFGKKGSSRDWDEFIRSL